MGMMIMTIVGYLLISLLLLAGVPIAFGLVFEKLMKHYR